MHGTHNKETDGFDAKQSVPSVSFYRIQSRAGSGRAAKCFGTHTGAVWANSAGRANSNREFDKDFPSRRVQSLLGSVSLIMCGIWESMLSISSNMALLVVPRLMERPIWVITS